VPERSFTYPLEDFDYFPDCFLDCVVVYAEQLTRAFLENVHFGEWTEWSKKMRAAVIPQKQLENKGDHDRNPFVPCEHAQ
jgi:hypothetical protein